ncbi:MAG TPA: LamG-like jellyroll fold domain-containing protein [Rhodothermales bacterium]
MVHLRYYVMAAGLVLTLASAAQAQTPAENLVHSYPFDNGAEDVVGGAHGTLAGAAEVFDGALVITDLEQWLELPAEQIAINTFDEITLEILYQPAGGLNTGYTMLAYFGGSTGGLGTNYYFISTARGDNISRAAISVGNTTTPWSAESGANGVEYDENELHHMVSTLTDSEITLYLDGVLSNVTPLAANNVIDSISTDFAYLARGGYTADPSWIGVIHEFNIYNRALTAEEIASLYSTATDVESAPEVPGSFALRQNFPNPFNPSTTISYTLPERSRVTLAVYDLLGHEVASLVDSEQAPGEYEVTFDGSDLASGVYLAVMRAGSFHQSRKLLLLK